MRVQMKPFLLIILFVGLTSLPSVSVLACEVKCCDLLPGETDKREREREQWPVTGAATETRS